MEEHPRDSEMWGIQRWPRSQFCSSERAGVSVDEGDIVFSVAVPIPPSVVSRSHTTEIIHPPPPNMIMTRTAFL